MGFSSLGSLIAPLMLFCRTIATKSTFKKGFIAYTRDHKILFVGDGDFSFEMCVTSLIGDATNITVTSLNSYGSTTATTISVVVVVIFIVFHMSVNVFIWHGLT